MQILVCDDDAATRLVLRRQFERAVPGCRVRECSDGAEGLRAVESTRFDLVVLDVEMPVIDGVAMLESIRRSPTTSHVPVLMASWERRADVVAHLVRLGVSGYLLKPLRPRTVTDTIEQLKSKLTVGNTRNTSGPIPRMTLDSPVMIVDGEAHYRRFFVEQAKRHAPVIEAASGAAALALFKRSPAPIVFIGAKLGVHSADLLAQRLRDSANGSVWIVGITNSRHLDGRSGCDETIKRTLVPAIHQAELQRFLPAPGALAGVSTMLGDLSEIVVADAQQVLGLLLDCDVRCSSEAPQPTELSSSVTLTVDERFTVTLSANLAEAPARTVASRLSSVDASKVTEQQMLECAGEIARLLGARLHSLVHQRERASTLSAVSSIRTKSEGLPSMDDSSLYVTLVGESVGAEVVVRVDAVEMQVAG